MLLMCVVCECRAQHRSNDRTKQSGKNNVYHDLCVKIARQSEDLIITQNIIEQMLENVILCCKILYFCLKFKAELLKSL